jgi:hypothetical protein
MAKIIILLGDLERDALYQLSKQEYRDPRAQAAIIIRDELIRRGLLTQESLNSITEYTGDRRESRSIT